jgi:hypothetical protein
MEMPILHSSFQDWFSFYPLNPQLKQRAIFDRRVAAGNHPKFPL